LRIRAARRQGHLDWNQARWKPVQVTWIEPPCGCDQSRLPGLELQQGDTGQVTCSIVSTDERRECFRTRDALRARATMTDATQKDTGGHRLHGSRRARLQAPTSTSTHVNPLHAFLHYSGGFFAKTSTQARRFTACPPSVPASCNLRSDRGLPARSRVHSQR